MVRLGWMQDTHFRPTGSERTDAASIWQSNYDDLVNNKGISDLYFTGDMMHPFHPWRSPTFGRDSIWSVLGHDTPRNN